MKVHRLAASMKYSFLQGRTIPASSASRVSDRIGKQLTSRTLCCLTGVSERSAFAAVPLACSFDAVIPVCQ